jgi:hypothetical protein
MRVFSLPNDRAAALYQAEGLPAPTTQPARAKAALGHWQLGPVL